MSENDEEEPALCNQINEDFGPVDTELRESIRTLAKDYFHQTGKLIKSIEIMRDKNGQLTDINRLFVQ